MIVGVGCDLCETSLMASELEKDGKGFRDMVFTPDEIAYCEGKSYPDQHYAARFAAKEALLKALPGQESKGVSWREVEIVNDRRGRPQVVLHGRIKSLAEQLQICGVQLSLSHTRHLGMAVIVLES